MTSAWQRVFFMVGLVSGFVGPALAQRPASDVPKGAVLVSNVDNSSEDKRSLGGSGHAEQFRRTDDANSVVAIQLFCSRYGTPQAPAENFRVYLLDSKQQVIKDLEYPYGRIERGQERWYTMPVSPAVEVPDVFYVALDFKPQQTKGVYVGMDKDVKESHSYIGLVNDGFQKAEGYDWMIRAYLAPAKAKKDTKRKAK